jgi:thymidylate kinase
MIGPSGKVAIIVGIDGAGKSTVLRRLRSFQTSHWRMLRQVSSEWADRVDNAAETMSKLRGRDRTAFILQLIEGEWKECILPNLTAGRDVVCDGFYLRPLIKEMVFGDGDVDAVLKASPLAGDELVLFVDVPVDVAVRRKHGHAISGYECFSSPADFADFQAAQRERLLALLGEWNHVRIDGTQSEADVSADVQRVLMIHGITPIRERESTEGRPITAGQS